MIITGLYIVKNEAKEIARSINSIKDICDEIVVVDTGSVDNTVETVKALGAVVHHFDWINDFSAARNYALSKANGDLIIFMDADEWFFEPLNQDDRKYFEKLVAEDYRVFPILRSNLDTDGSLSIPNYNTRMFRGKLGIQYEGAIHESINDVRRTFYLPERYLLHHSGYEGDLQREKIERNIKILLAEMSKKLSPDRLLLNTFYLAREHGLYGDSEKSCEYIEQFFKTWSKTPVKSRQANVGISAYHFAANMYFTLGEARIPNELYKKCCDAFVRDFPKHPASHAAMVKYHYDRHRDYGQALKSIARVEDTAAKYDINDYPHDYVGAEEPLTNSIIIKGNILFDLGERAQAFDCYVSLLKKMDANPGFLRRILSLIKDQPTDDIVAFLSAIPPAVTTEYLEILLGQLLYFPSMRDVYMYFAVQHMKQNRQHSDISALAALIRYDSYDMVLVIAQALRHSDPFTADTLFMLAAMCSGERDFGHVAKDFPKTERLLTGFFSGVSPDELSDYDLRLAGRILQVVLFLGDSELRDRFFKVISEYTFIFAYMLLSYCSNSGQYAELIGFISIDESALEVEDRAAFYRLMGHANIVIGDYDDAWSYLRESFTLFPGDLHTYKELRMLASAAPALADDILSLIGRFAAATPGAENERLAALNSVFE